MRLSGAAWSFVGTTLQESAEIWRALKVGALDLLAAPGATLDAGAIVDDPGRSAAAIRELGMPVANLIFCFASSLSERALNHPDIATRSRNAKDFEAVLAFCRQCGIPSVTVLPGVEQPGWPREKSLAVSAECLNQLESLAAAQGIALLFEAHVQSILESPAEVLAFLRSNPRLKLTLDYSHFIWHGCQQEEVDCLAPYTGHVHLRQCAPGVLQARWDEGVVDFRKVVEVLEGSGYRGWYALEYEHDSWLGNDRVDVMTETVRMRNLARNAGL